MSHVTKPAEIISLGVMVTIGNLTPYALPVIVGALVDHLHLEPRLAGYLGTAELIGLGLGAAIFSAVILKVSWRLFALSAIILSILANVATPCAGGVPMLFAIRFFSGLGGGMLLAMAAAGLFWGACRSSACFSRAQSSTPFRSCLRRRAPSRCFSPSPG